MTVSTLAQALGDLKEEAVVRGLKKPWPRARLL